MISYEAAHRRVTKTRRALDENLSAWGEAAVTPTGASVPPGCARGALVNPKVAPIAAATGPARGHDARISLASLRDSF
jgi:hypothetical protein